MLVFFEKVIKHKKTVILIFVFAAAVCAFMMLGVGQNYDMSKYLPKSSESKEGIDILKTEFSYNGIAVMMIEDKTIAGILDVKRQAEGIKGVEDVIWLDDAADIKQPAEMIGEEIKGRFLDGDDALLHIVFKQDDYSAVTREAILELKDVFGEEVKLSGSAIDAQIMIDSISGNIMVGILIALAIVLVILLVTTNSVIEVLLFLAAIGIAILMNMGTNIIFGEISYMTFACAAILQLAISMDYSIFLLHRFEYERASEPDASKAMAKAVRASLSSILSSGLTTFVGFIALVFMSYTIGADMGLVLAKGIVFSLLSVLLFLPAAAVGCAKAIDKTKHKKLLPNMGKVQHLLAGKAKYAVFAVMIVVSVVCFMAQNRNTFLYSTSSLAEDRQSAVNEQIKEKFGDSNEFLVLVPNGNGSHEYEMAGEIKSLPSVKSVQGLYAYIDPAIPEEIVPDDIKEEFLSERYSRYIVDVNVGVETEEAFRAVEDIRGISAKYYERSYVTGASPVIYDIMHATSGDFSLVTWLSILFVGIILLFTFRSATLPVILMFIIEACIWINMSIPYFTGEPMIFIGYIIISAVQLGATIDYAILMTNYYLEGRKTLAKREASEYAAQKAGMSIVMSALVLSSAGFVVSATFTQQALSQLGTLIGRGALLSGFFTVFVLPQVLILLDGVIKKTDLRNIFRRKKHEA